MILTICQNYEMIVCRNLHLVGIVGTAHGPEAVNLLCHPGLHSEDHPPAAGVSGVGKSTLGGMPYQR